jgi:hypothetical protein
MESDKKTPLSEKPLGLLLAFLGGTLGAPLGWIGSPVVLIILNNVMKEKEGKQPNRFLIWSLIGIISAPLLMNITADYLIGNGLKSDGGYCSMIKGTTGINMENYSKLQTGMSYEEVVAILGKTGEEVSSNDIAGYKNVMYKWSCDGSFGMDMNTMFQNGKLIQKAQFGLK